MATARKKILVVDDDTDMRRMQIFTFLKKPFQGEDLLPIIADALSGRRSAREC